MASRREFINKGSLSLLGLAAVPTLLSQCTAPDESMAADIFSFPRVSPESEGVDSQALINFINTANKSGLEWHSFKILRRGKVLAEGHWEPFKEEYKHTLYSLSKAFTSTAIGLAEKEGLISVEDPVISFFPNELPEVVDDQLKFMKIKHLLTMNSGHDSSTMESMRTNSPEKTWVQSFLSKPLVHEPGTHFFYNTGATYMLGAIIHAKTGQNLEAFLKPRFFDKLGITGYDWEKSPEGLNTAGYGLRVKTEDISKLGQFYLQNGTWLGDEILSEEWVTEASTKHTESQAGNGDWSQGYGYQFWRCKPEPGFYRGDGAFGQYCIIIPQYEMTIAVTSESFNMGKSMEIIWDNVLPGVKEEALPANKNAASELKEICQNLSIDPPIWHSTSPSATLHTKKIFKAEKNDYGIESLAFDLMKPHAISSREFDLSKDEGEVVFHTLDGENKLVFGMEHWVTNDVYTVNNFPLAKRIHVPSLISASATWVDDDTLQITRKFVEAVHGDTLVCAFKGNQVTISFNNSLSENSKNASDTRPPMVAIA